jgi:hypothetical protein
MGRTLRRDSYGGPTSDGDPRAIARSLLVPLTLLAVAAFPAAARATAIGLSDEDPAAVRPTLPTGAPATTVSRALA